MLGALFGNKKASQQCSEPDNTAKTVQKAQIVVDIISDPN
jgi:hypothetical protein